MEYTGIMGKDLKPTASLRYKEHDGYDGYDGWGCRTQRVKLESFSYALMGKHTKRQDSARTADYVHTVGYI